MSWALASGRGQDQDGFAVVRPFQGGKFLQPRNAGSAAGQYLAEAISGLSLTYNRSDNFIAQGPAYELFLKQLPNQSGTSKDLGFWITTLNGKLSLRCTHFVTSQNDLRNGDISTIAQRILRYEGFIATDSYNLRTQTSAWLNGLGSGGTATNAQIAAAIKMPLEQYNGLSAIAANNTYAAVQDAESKRHEVEINLNPTRHWIISASVTRTQAVTTRAGSAVDDYIAGRMPVWTTLEDPRFTNTTQTLNGVTSPLPTLPGTPLPTGATGHLLGWNILGTPFSTIAGYNGTQSPALNYAGNVDPPMAVFRAQIGRPRPQIREYSAKFNTRYNLAGISESRILKNMAVVVPCAGRARARSASTARGIRKVWI